MSARPHRSVWLFALVFLPIETWVSWSNDGRPLSVLDVSGYLVNIAGVAIMLWGTVSLRRGRAHADGLIAAGWGWTTAVFWRATNLRFLLASAGEPLTFGATELWLAPVATLIVAALFARSLMAMVGANVEGASVKGPA
jgi:hypothetical protein